MLPLLHYLIVIIYFIIQYYSYYSLAIISLLFITVAVVTTDPLVHPQTPDTPVSESSSNPAFLLPVHYNFTLFFFFINYYCIIVIIIIRARRYGSFVFFFSPLFLSSVKLNRRCVRISFDAPLH